MIRSLFRDIPPKANGRLFLSRFAPKDREEVRGTRMQRALDTKCPKLRQCKGEGARSILILENNDIALTNHIVVGDSVRALLEGRDDEDTGQLARIQHRLVKRAAAGARPRAARLSSPSPAHRCADSAVAVRAFLSAAR
jgi:hypothetical protein